jgi:hypothetical protein
MKLRELIKIFNNLPDKYQDYEVILQKDSEGNGFTPLYDVDVDCIYNDGEIYDMNWSYEDSGFDNDDEWKTFIKNKKKCIVLFP